MNIRLEQKPAFRRSYKKLHANQQDAVHKAIRAVIAAPELGEAKKGDLADVFVYKFECVNQTYLLGSVDITYRSQMRAETKRTNPI